MATTADPVELRVAEIHHRAAAAIRRDASLVGAAAGVLDGWMAQEGSEPDPVLLEWKAVFDFLDAREIADFLEAQSPFARRLRSSSPFPPIVPDEPRTIG